MTDDNIVSFSDAVVKKSQRNTPYITDTYNCFEIFMSGWSIQSCRLDVDD